MFGHRSSKEQYRENYIRCVLFSQHHRSVILSEVARALCELRSRRTPKSFTLPRRIAPFRPTLPWRWSCKSLVLETVRTVSANRTLRGPSTPRPQKLGRSAQDDGFKVIKNTNSTGYSFRDIALKRNTGIWGRGTLVSQQYHSPQSEDVVS